MNLLLAAAAAMALAALAWRTRLLTLAGAFAATLVGVLTLAPLGWAGGAVLMAFFLPSSLVSRLTRSPEAGLDPKGEVRGAGQVLANGFLPAAAAAIASSTGHPELAWRCLAGGLAVAGADTWATAIGSRSRASPRHIMTGRPVPRGTSGAVTWLGTLAAAAGAAVVGLVVSLLHGPGILLPAAVIIGVIGMGVDSVLGATGQARFVCRSCGTASEWPRHRCGARTEFQGGIRWMDNDVVNLIATGAGTAAGALWWVFS